MGYDPSMAEILCVSSGLPSVVYPALELARRLGADGHGVTFAGQSRDRELVEHLGLAFLPLEPSHYADFLQDDARTGLFRRLRTVPDRQAQALDSVAVAGFREAIQKLGPDLVLIDGEMHEHILVAMGTGVRIALLNSFCSIWKRPGLPPPHHLVRPGVGLRGSRPGIAFLWRLLRWRKRYRAFTHRVRRLGCDRLSILRLLAEEAGLDLERETDDRQWLIPFTYRRLPVLSLHALEFEFPHRPPPHVRYVGPQLLEQRKDRPMSEADEARLTALLDRRRDGNCRLIYAGFGSAFSTDVEFLRRLFGVVAERPDWELVVSLGGGPAPDDLGTPPERVHTFEWLPQLRVLEQADVAVTHGGINTLDECVLSGVPVLVYCGFETDMGGNTARVLHHGLGLAGDRRRDDTATIRHHLDRLLKEGEFRGKVRQLRKRYQVYELEGVAERTVEALIEEAEGATS